MRLLRTPMSVFISLTYRCNLRCVHCAVYSDQIPEADLDTESWMTFFRELADAKVFRVRLSGGEPFVREDIWDLLDALHRLPMRFGVNTNAMRIDGKAAKKLKAYRKLDELMVSLDGGCPETHDAMRGRGTFQKVVDGIEQIVAAGLPLSLYCTVTRHNFRNLGQITELAAGWGVNMIKHNYLLPEGRGLKNYGELALNKTELDETIDELRALREKHGSMVSGTILDLGDMFDGIRSSSETAAGGNRSSVLSGCGALIRECAVRPDGWITPCDRIPDLCAGHIHEHRFREIWQSSEAFTAFRRRREILLDELEECRGCTYQAHCRGGCPAVPYALYHTVAARDPLSCYRIYSGQETFHVP